MNEFATGLTIVLFCGLSVWYAATGQTEAFLLSVIIVNLVLIAEEIRRLR